MEGKDALEPSENQKSGEEADDADCNADTDADVSFGLLGLLNGGGGVAAGRRWWVDVASGVDDFDRLLRVFVPHSLRDGKILLFVVCNENAGKASVGGGEEWCENWRRLTLPGGMSFRGYIGFRLRHVLVGNSSGCCHSPREPWR